MPLDEEVVRHLLSVIRFSPKLPDGSFTAAELAVKTGRTTNEVAQVLARAYREGILERAMHNHIYFYWVK